MLWTDDATLNQERSEIMLEAAIRPDARCKATPYTQVRIDDAFWAPRQRVNHESTIPAIHRQLESTGRIAALRGIWSDENIAAVKSGQVTQLFFDSDIAKWLEAASYSLALQPDPELDALVDRVIVEVAHAQQSDGYLNSWFGYIEPERRWANLRDLHELYCAGHLIEAGVAHFEATGKRTLLDIVCRYADYIDSVFGTEEGKLRGYCGHPEIELALVRLYQTTNNRKYLDLARYFVDERGQTPNYFEVEARARGEDPEHPHFVPKYNQSHKPVREQTEVVGHAVRAAYLYSAMADLAREDGDATLLAACERLWTNLTTKRMYVMGGIGTSARNEGFTTDYDLPNESAYAETCAAIALVFWANRMLQLDCNRRYSDIMELALYNAVLSGVSCEGSHFFYSNPLSSDGENHRWEWHVCPCCPPNLARLLASIGGYIYTQSQDEVAVHLYVQSDAKLALGGQQVRIRQQTNYPWSEEIAINIGVAQPVSFRMRLRLPAWCTSPSLTVNGDIVDISSVEEGGYALIDRVWSDGDQVALKLPMTVERLYAHPDVTADAGMTALRRGPFVYCFEQVDHDVPLGRIALPADAQLTANFDAGLLGGTNVVSGQGIALSNKGWEDVLYRTAAPTTHKCSVRAIPYYAWDNRGPGKMTVWVREQPEETGD